MLAQLGQAPSPARERRARLVGRAIAVFCHVGGWLAPMYGAGRLERGNIVEYETAARLARRAGRPELVDCLLTMAEVEWDHEEYFGSRVESHRLARWLPMWTPPPPRSEIRDSFDREMVTAAVS